jgi:hypothetical protein
MLTGNSGQFLGFSKEFQDFLHEQILDTRKTQASLRFPAAFRCDAAMLGKLLDAKADPAAKAQRVGTALMMAGMRGGYPPVSSNMAAAAEKSPN